MPAKYQKTPLRSARLPVGVNTSFWKEALGCWWPGLLLAVWFPGAGADGCVLAALWSALAGLVDTDPAPWLVCSGSPIDSKKPKQTDTDTV